MKQLPVGDYGKFYDGKKGFPGSGLVRGSWHDGPDSPVARMIIGRLSECRRLIDVGANDRQFIKLLVSSGYTGSYESVDFGEGHDHIDFLAVEGSYDCVTMFELIEHLSLEDGVAYIKHASRLLVNGGSLMISTPNADHPNHIWRSDITHIRPWPARDLWSILQECGFSGPNGFYRQYIPGVSGSLTKSLIRTTFLAPAQRIASRILDLDYAQGLLVFAIK
ncbi:MAG: class I SAM-dependent methyltransferase [Thermoleophilia bacterium]